MTVNFTYRPAPPLDRFVRILWYWEGPPEPHPRERLLPDGQIGIVINLDESQSMRGLVVGAHSTYFMLDTHCKRHVAGIQFWPGCASPFLRVPADALHNVQLSLDDLWGAAAEEVRERMLAAITPERKLAILEEALLQRLRLPSIPDPAPDPAVAFAVRCFGSPTPQTVRQVTEQIGHSHRRFLRVFGEEVGMTPKLFCRVLRFQRLLRRIGSETRMTWLEAALDCGYFDQAHFIHEFREFTGLAPSSYAAHKTEHLNHLRFGD